MFRRIQPVSDLQRVQRFDDDDLAANRAGQLSMRQRMSYAASRLGEHLLGVLIVLFFFAWLVHLLQAWLSLEIIGLVFAALLLVTLLLFAYQVNRALRKGVKGITGPVSKHERVPLAGLALDEISVGETRFFVRSEVFKVLEDMTVCKAYYLERSSRAGGYVLLSLESME